MSTLNKIKAEKMMTDVYHGNVSLAQIPKLREGFEEIGIRKDDVTSISLLGITRELVRGGEPEMFFSALTELSEKQVRKSWKRAKDKWESKKLIFHNFRLSKLDEK